MTISKTINECNYSDKQLLWRNIVLSGYTSKLLFLPERLKEELLKVAPPKTVVNIIALPDREHAGCIGASLLVTAASYDWVKYFAITCFNEGNIPAPPFIKKNYKPCVPWPYNHST